MFDVLAIFLNKKPGGMKDLSSIVLGMGEEYSLTRLKF